MATVYLAEDLKHRRKVALKVLRPELSAVLGAERFLREIEIAAGLTHPHVLPLYDSGNSNGTLFYVMPYVEGESVRDRLKREKQLPVSDAVRIACQVAEALDYAHRHGVVHRDIKSENVLLEENHAVLADFGIARAISVAGGEQLTSTGIIVGTPTYMSPEQAAGSAELDGRSDVYALGCVLYEMLAGEPPFTGTTAESIVRQHMMAEPPSLTGIRAAVPPGIEHALRRALSKTPADRFSTAAQFQQALQAAADESDATATTTSRTRRAFLRRGALVAGVVALAGLTWFALGRTGSGSPGNAGVALPRLAVVPFENLGTAEQDYFTDGISDEIMAKLAGLRGLAVISRQSAMQYKGVKKSSRQIGKELGAQYLLAGRSGGNICRTARVASA